MEQKKNFCFQYSMKDVAEYSDHIVTEHYEAKINK